MEGTVPPALAPDAERAVREAFLAQPFLRYTGVHVISLAEGACELHLPFRADLAQADGAFDGSIVAALAQHAGALAAQTLLPEQRVALTVEFKVNIMAAGRGERLVARGQVIRGGRTLTVCRADVTCLAGGVATPCATCLITLQATAR